MQAAIFGALVLQVFKLKRVDTKSFRPFDSIRPFWRVSRWIPPLVILNVTPPAGVTPATERSALAE